MKERQVSFAGGELAPSLHGRTDLALYPIGARTLENFIVSPHGVLVNRPGTRRAFFEDNLPWSRLVPFVFSETDKRVLCFTIVAGVGILMILRPQADGSLVRVETKGITPYNTEEIVRSLRFAQVGNVVTIVTEHVAPYELTRVTSGSTETDDDEWTLEEMSFEIPIYLEAYGQPAVLFTATTINLNGVEIEIPEHAFTGSASRPPREWQWAITRILRDEDGRLFETMPRRVTLCWDGDNDEYAGLAINPIAVYGDWEQRIVWGDYTSGGTWLGAFDETLGYTLVATRVYRGRGGTGGITGSGPLDGLFGYLGESRGDYYVDDGREPDYESPPPRGVNPFKIYDASGSLVRTENPSAVAYFEGRLILGSTEERPALGLGSALDDFKNFDELIPAGAEDSLSFSLLSQRQEKIRAFVPRKQLMALTSSGAWRVAGADGGPLTPTSIQAHIISRDGCAALAPVEARGSIFFLETSGSVPRVMVFASEDAGPEIVEVAIQSLHLFEGYSIVAWAYAENPHKLLWAVRSDGALLSMTYVPGHNTAAWAKHTVTDGVVEDVCVIPDGSEDAVFLVVQREDSAGDEVRYIERLAPRLVDDARVGCFLDAAVSYGAGSDGNTMHFADFDEEMAVDTSVAMAFDEQLAAVGVCIETENPAGGGPLRFTVDSYDGVADGLHVYVCTVITRPFPAAMGNVATDDWRYCTQSVSGLDHLEGQTVSALLDGNARTGLVVSGGAVNFGETDDDWVSYAHIGLPYNSDFESLDAINERDKKKTTEEVIIEYLGTRGGQTGATLDNLTEVRTREVSDSYLSMELKRQERRVPISDRWAESGRVAFRQSAPLPVTLLGLTRVVKYGG